MDKENTDSIVQFSIHLDTPTHYIRIAEFIEFTKSIEEIISEFNEEIFEESVSVSLLILPAEDGSFLQKIGIFVFGAIASTTLGDTWAWFVKWLTWHEPSYYGELAGKNIATFFKDATEWFLSRDVSDLEENGINQDVFPRAIYAKNSFYKTGLQNSDIRGIWFSPKNIFPIWRDSFPAKITNDVLKDKKIPSKIKLHELVITAPVITKDQSTLWHTKDKKTGKPLKFFMKDKEFLADFLAGRYPIKSTQLTDTVIVSVRYDYIERSDWSIMTTRHAIRVFKLNKHQILPIPENWIIERVGDDGTDSADGFPSNAPSPRFKQTKLKI